jgi:hypothetical protein
LPIKSDEAFEGNPGNAVTGPINPAEPAVSDHGGLFSQIMLGH